MIEDVTNILCSLWQTFWRRTSITLKALVISAFMGVFFWVIVDLWQTTQVKVIFRQKLLHDIEIQAQRDRTLFDEYIRSQQQAVRMLSYTSSFVNYIHKIEESWSVDPNLYTQWFGDDRPPWLPPRSVMRGLVAAPYIMLLDGEKRIRELFLREEGLSSLSRMMQDKIIPELLSRDEYSHIVADVNGIPYLINVSGVQGAKPVANPKAFLVLISVLNDDFLSIFHNVTETKSIIVLFNGGTNQVFASSQPDKVKVGMMSEQLATQYAIFGKKFLDYDFSIDVPIRFATLVPLEEISLLTNAIVHAERQQRAIGYSFMAIILFILVYSMTKSIQRFTERMVETAIDKLDLKKQDVATGDQLLIMGEQFHWMIDEILGARRLEEARQHELKMANQSLMESLGLIKRTQSDLVEAEKMASLGNLVAGVAHEINTPMGTAVTAASFLRQQSQECVARFENGTLSKSNLVRFFEDLQESTQMILNNLNRAAELVRSFKLVAVDRTHAERRVFGLHEYIHQILISLRPQLKKTKINVIVECSETLKIKSHPGVFSQIITNFIMNSIMHGFQAEEEGKILLQVSQTGGDLLLRYSDNGCGMEETNRQRVFEPFFTTARHRGCSGLGMHIVFNLVTQTLQGTIHCVSAPGQGTLYEVLIPMEPKMAEK